jgi:two-component system cell cycle sensor histidine kinase/response regulator CckA
MHLIHDLRNLLTVGAGLVDSLRAARHSEPSTIDALEQLSRCFDSMFEMVDDLLPPADLVLATQPIELNQLVLECVSLFRSALKRSVELKIQPLRRPARVKARAIDIQRILLNLILSASEAMPDGGVITVHTDVLPSIGRDNQVDPSLPPAVRLTVSDSGAGLRTDWGQPEQLVPDASATRSLGLASVRLVVLRLGGHVVVESGDSRGTSVHIDFPEAPAAS